MWACNYDFACDDSHSSDLNVVLFSEGKRQHFDEVLPLHLARDRTIHLHQRNSHSPPPPFFSSPLPPWPWRLACLIKRKTRTKTWKNNRRLRQRFRGLSISSASYESENNVCVASDAWLIRWSRDVRGGPCTFTKRSTKGKVLNMIIQYFWKDCPCAVMFILRSTGSVCHLCDMKKSLTFFLLW